MPDLEDVPELLDDVADDAVRLRLLDSILNPPGDSMDAQGRFFSPWIERGSDGVPHAVPVPSLAAMRDMNAGQLSGLCGRYGYVETWESSVDINQGYLARFNIGPTLPNGQSDPRYAREMGRLKVNNQRAMLGHTRRLAINHEVVVSLNGKLNTRVVIINESDTPCEECDPLGGVEDTYRNLVANGQIPSEVCLGSCMCTFMAVG